MNQNLKIVVAAAASATVVGFATKDYIHTVRIERAKRNEIERNRRLDLKATKLAQANMAQKIVDGEYPVGSASKLLADFQNEIDFNKIAIRY